MPAPLQLDLAGQFSGRAVLVTGGLGGIGSACVDSFLAHGAKVALSYVPRHERVDHAQARCATAPDTLSIHAMDLQDPASIARCVTEAVDRWNGIDVLVNNAAVGSATVAAFAGTAAGQDTAMLTINADGTLKMCQAYIEAMSGRMPDHACKIINLSSVGGGIAAFPGFRLSDGMSKAAVAFLTRQLAAEMIHSGFDVFAICPGATRTAMFQASTLAPMSEQERDAFVRRLPKRRLIEPEEIARIITFLASDYSTPLHGSVIDASMGLGVRPGLIDGAH